MRNLQLPDKRQHRGPHPQDRELFAPQQVPRLRRAASDLSWLLSRGYTSNAAIKLVGDHHCLSARQRLAIGRCACGEEQAARRRKHEMTIGELVDQELWIDGFNVLTSIEAALSGGVILHARDDCYRDMASMHGSYKKVRETIAAIRLIGNTVEPWNLSRCHWLLDQPVSNSGMLKSMLREIAAECGWTWTAELVPDPDPILGRIHHVVASADSQILDRADRWLNLARIIIDRQIHDAWLVDLSNVADRGEQ